ncbi:hypothetical protein ACFOUO_11100 [Salinithrix halophila]|uniref:Uncharacterized protein n=1 Tax=Salinithrix halophila TaxID=1485204 RepID=A0ABV8JEG9_9BACL
MAENQWMNGGRSNNEKQGFDDWKQDCEEFGCHLFSCCIGFLVDK